MLRHHPRSRSGAFAAVAIAVAVVISGCAGSPEPVTPTTTATPSSTPTSPAPTPPAPDPQPDATDAGTWIVSSDGIGPIELGDGLTDVEPFLTAFTRIEQAPDCNLAAFRGTGDTERLAISIVTEPDDLETILQVFAMTAGDPTSPPVSAPHTDSGVTLGTSESELTRLHDDLTLLQDAGYAIYELAAGDHSWVYFLVSRTGTSPVADPEVERVYGLVSSSVEGVGADYCV